MFNLVLITAEDFRYLFVAPVFLVIFQLLFVNYMSPVDLIFEMAISFIMVTPIKNSFHNYVFEEINENKLQM